MRSNQGFKYIALSVLLLVASLSIARTTLDIIKSSKRLDDVKNNISSLQQQKEDLTASINYKKSPDYVEKIARNELNLVKPGESLYVVKGSKDPETDSSKEVDVLAASSARLPGRLTIKDRTKNLSVWWHLLF